MKNDTNDGRYTVVDLPTGRKFTVEVIHNRNDRSDGDWTNGGIDKVKNRGSISEDESIINEENGFKNIGYAKNPTDYINELLKK
jgi:hypothetical protein